MKEIDIIRTLEQHFDAAWADRTPVQRMNSKTLNEDEYVSIEIAFTAAENSTVGGRVQTTSGIFSVKVFTSINIGVKKAYEHADVIKTSMLNKSIETILTYVPTISPLSTDNENLYGVIVKTPFSAT